jgi:LPS sulfotransferase NodH
LKGDDVALLADNFQGEGWLLFKPNADGVRPEELPSESADAGVKTAAQRLRATIMVLWRQTGSSGDPEAFYRNTMAKLQEYILSKIPEGDNT